jgi:ribokinase
MKTKKTVRKSITGLPYDIISIGDATMDMFLGLNTVSNRVCRKDTEECFLQLSYADKIEADFQEFATGGNSANLAIGASRLGLKVAFYTSLGKDEIGDILKHSVVREGVAEEYIKRESGLTNFHVVLNHEAERTIIIYHNKRRYKLPALKRAAWVYYSSMGEGFEALHPALVKYVKKHKVKLGFNPGTIQLKAGFKALEPVLKITEILIVNKEEGHRLLGLKHNGVEIKDLLTQLHHTGPKQVVVTDGPKGAYAFDGKKYWYMPIFDVPVIERTGAGDSYSTGVISAMASGKEMQEALRWATFNSASVIQEVGPQKGLLKKAAMQKFLRAHKDIAAKEL